MGRPLRVQLARRADVALVAGFRLERADSMLFTLAARCNEHRFERIAEKAWHLGLVTPESLRGYVDHSRRRGRSGVRRMLWWLDKVGTRSRAMQSNFEVDLLRHAVRTVGLPEPRKQHPLTFVAARRSTSTWPGPIADSPSSPATLATTPAISAPASVTTHATGRATNSAG